MDEYKVTTSNGTIVPEEFIQQARYELFKLNWMMSHGYTLTNLLESILTCQKESLEDTDALEELQDANQLMHLWEENGGFDGELYPCFEEFLETDDKFMAENTMLYADHAKFIKTVAIKLFKESQT